MTVLKLSSLCLMTVLLSACNFGSNNDNKSSNELSTIGKVSADGEPVEIYDPGALAQDITKLFGEADGEPIDVEAGDTFQDVVDRGGRS